MTTLTIDINAGGRSSQLETVQVVERQRTGYPSVDNGWPYGTPYVTVARPGIGGMAVVVRNQVVGGDPAVIAFLESAPAVDTPIPAADLIARIANQHWRCSRDEIAAHLPHAGTYDLPEADAVFNAYHCDEHHT